MPKSSLFRSLLTIIALVIALKGPAAAQQLEYHFRENLPVGGQQFPVNLTVRLEEQERTRLKTDLFVDLTSFEQRLPELINGPLYDDCRFGVSVDLQTVEARARSAAIGGKVTLRLNNCVEENGTEVIRPGLSGRVDFTADLSAEVAGNCLLTGLEDLELNGRGLVGGLADLLGIVERARSLILVRAAEVTSENPICPDLPDALEVLDPQFNRGGFRAFPNGALGAIMGGSIEVSATTLLALIASLEESGAFETLGANQSCDCD